MNQPARRHALAVIAEAPLSLHLSARAQDGALNGFLEDRGTFALFNCMGTPMIDAVL